MDQHSVNKKGAVTPPGVHLDSVISAGIVLISVGKCWAIGFSNCFTYCFELMSILGFCQLVQYSSALEFGHN